MNWDNGMIEEPINPVTPTPQTYGVTDLEKATWNAKQNALVFDTHAAQGSYNSVYSGVVYEDIMNAKQSITQAYQAYFQGQVDGLASLAATVGGVVDTVTAAQLAAQQSAQQADTAKEQVVVNTSQVLSYLEATSRINGYVEVLHQNVSEMFETFMRLGGIDLGVTHEDSFYGDLGQIAYEHSQVLNGNPHHVTKAEVGLSNVDNTSDIAKPVSSQTTEVLALKADLVGGKIPAVQLPGFVDDFLEYAGLANFPVVGESGKMYVDTNTDLCYRWSGTAYRIISDQITLGETSSTAYRGDRGKSAYDHTSRIDNPHGVTKAQVGLSNVNNTTDSVKAVASAAKWTTPITFTLNGDVSGSVSVDGSGNATVATTVADNSHNHTASNVTDFAAAVRGIVLTGLSTVTNAAILATDTVLTALGKLQKQTTDNLATLTTHTSRVDNPHAVTKTQVGLGSVDNTADSAKAVASAGKWTNARTISLTGDVTGSVDVDGSANASIAATVADNSHSHTASNISDFAANVRSTVLTGLSTATNAAITATDTLLVSLGKLQKQITDDKAALATHVARVDNPHTVTKAQVGLGSVDNTTDANKPLSTAAINAFALKADLVGGVVPINQLPAFTDGLELGVAHDTAYYGDLGAAAYTHSQVTGSNPHNTPASVVPITVAGVTATNTQAAVAEVLGKLSGCYVNYKDAAGITTADLYLHY